MMEAAQNTYRDVASTAEHLSCVSTSKMQYVANETNYNDRLE